VSTNTDRVWLCKVLHLLQGHRKFGKVAARLQGSAADRHVYEITADHDLANSCGDGIAEHGIVATGDGTLVYTYVVVGRNYALRAS
jgi:hypothetical protein